MKKHQKRGQNRAILSKKGLFQGRKRTLKTDQKRSVREIKISYITTGQSYKRKHLLTLPDTLRTLLTLWDWTCNCMSVNKIVKASDTSDTSKSYCYPYIIFLTFFQPGLYLCYKISISLHHHHQSLL